ncbi:phage tail tube protein [uncultured Phocaeicola sp.]|jgi:predicted secreted protein|uniref:phage tail tube protein n=1 Tax=uncultured Phocaeicola sp. TaxID=990718 RepID=UPI00258FEDC8|nr:phage tail tube protein [uncultured Phocaeicola sp.]
MAEKKYDSSKDMVVGDKLMLFVEITKELQKEVVPIAFGTSCGIDISADTIDTSNKMSGNWKEYLTGQLGYTVSSESMLSLKTGHLSFVTLKELMKKRTPIPFVIAKTEESEGDFPKGEEYVKGNAIITALSMKADNGAICTSSVTLQGTGPLEDGAGA